LPEHQAQLLRRFAANQRVNDQLDWDHLTDEVESAGREQLDAVESLLFQALVHMLKAQGWPQFHAVESWRADARGFRAQATNRFAPSMRPRIDLDRIFRQAVRALPATMDGLPPPANAGRRRRSPNRPPRAWQARH
jgi:hypothetical protein